MKFDPSIAVILALFFYRYKTVPDCIRFKKTPTVGLLALFRSQHISIKSQMVSDNPRFKASSGLEGVIPC